MTSVDEATPNPDAETDPDEIVADETPEPEVPADAVELAEPLPAVPGEDYAALEAEKAELFDRWVRLQAEFDTRTGTVQRALSEFLKDRFAEILAWERKLGVPILPLSAGEETVPQVRRLMGISGSTR